MGYVHESAWVALCDMFHGGWLVLKVFAGQGEIFSLQPFFQWTHKPSKIFALGAHIRSVFAVCYTVLCSLGKNKAIFFSAVEIFQGG